MPAPLPQSVDQLLQRMVAINTVNAARSGNLQAEAPLVDYLQGVAEQMGLVTRRLPVVDAEGRDRGDNLLITTPPQPGRPWLLFESHMDTVSVDGMTIDPFAAEIRDGRLYGRGSCDTKGTGAAALWALAHYAASPAPSGGGTSGGNNIAVLFTVDEEFGMTGIRSFLKDHRRVLGFEPRGVIVGEPTSLRPVVAHNGAMRFRITTRGVACHSSTPDKGLNAISMMSHVIRAIEDNYIAKLSASHPLTGKAVCSITLIQGGTQINIIPDTCSIDIDRRLVPGEPPEGVRPAIDEILEGLRKKLSGLPGVPDLKVENDAVLGFCPALSPQASASLLPTVQRVLSDLNLPTAPASAPYATDAGDLALSGIPALVIGPGDGSAAHTKDESVELAQIDLGVRFYLALMRTPLSDLR